MFLSIMKGKKHYLLIFWNKIYIFNYSLIIPIIHTLKYLYILKFKWLYLLIYKYLKAYYNKQLKEQANILRNIIYIKLK